MGGAVQSWSWGGTLTERGLCAGSEDRREQELVLPAQRGNPGSARSRSSATLVHLVSKHVTGVCVYEV